MMEYTSLPSPPGGLHSGGVILRFAHTVPGDPERDFVPYYHFRIIVGADFDAGHINFRVGDTEHVRMYAGHVGFGIAEGHRGNGYAGQACIAIAPLVQRFYRTVVLTCNPENMASRRTIERLGAEFIEEVDVPPSEPMYKNGVRVKRRYAWTP